MTVQKRLYQTCIECEDKQWFGLSDPDPDGLSAVYTCEECDHAIRLDLDASQ